MTKYTAAILLAAAGLVSCTKEDEYKEFAAGGEITYPGRVDSVIVQSGYNRLNLKIVMGSDPAVTRLKAYWNDRADSVEVELVRTEENDTLDIMIDDLAEGQYNFNIYTYDSENNVSVVKNASGNVYGDSYQRALANRGIKSLQRSRDGHRIIIDWNAPGAGEAAMELNYTDVNGVSRSLTAPGGQMVTELPSYEEESLLRYRSIFLPEPDAIDTFVVEHSEVMLPFFEGELAKEKFSILVLPTDVQEGGYGWLMTDLWDDDYGVPGFATQSREEQWFTFDMGVSAKLYRFKTWQASDRLYKLENVKKFEVWGSNDPNPDGSWDSWTKLMTCESVKPSGLPLGEVSDADVAYATAGEEFIFPEDIPAVRYIRIKVLERWGNGAFVTMGELAFWTRDR